MALYLTYEGRCAICNKPLGDDWHADHIIPVGAATDVINGQLSNMSFKEGK